MKARRFSARVQCPNQTCSLARIAIILRLHTETDRKDDMPAVPRSRGPLRSRFPGELALRDLNRFCSLRKSELVVARLVVLQLAERFAAGHVDAALRRIEVEAAALYVEPLIGRYRDALCLTRVLDRIAEDEPRRVTSALLSCGDRCKAVNHVMGAYGFYLCAFELATHHGYSAAALSASSRLSDLATLLDRTNAGSRWTRRKSKLVEICL
jgi:hypothetical protein